MDQAADDEDAAEHGGSRRKRWSLLRDRGRDTWARDEEAGRRRFETARPASAPLA
jgi:hypothetical protein